MRCDPLGAGKFDKTSLALALRRKRNLEVRMKTGAEGKTLVRSIFDDLFPIKFALIERITQALSKRKRIVSSCAFTIGQLHDQLLRGLFDDNPFGAAGENALRHPEQAGLSFVVGVALTNTIFVGPRKEKRGCGLQLPPGTGHPRL